MTGSAGAQVSFEPLSFVGGPPSTHDATEDGSQAQRQLLAPLLAELTRKESEREAGPGAELASDLEPNDACSQAELAEAVAAAREEGGRDGVARGRAEMTEVLERRLADAVEALAAVLASEVEAHRSAVAKATADLDLALGIVRCVIPRTLEQAPLADVEPMLRELMAGLVGEPRLELRLPPDLLEPGRTMLTEVAARAGFEGACSVEPDPELGLGDAHLHWAHARAERSVTAIVDEVERILRARAGDANVPDGTAEATSGSSKRAADEEGGS